MFFNSNVIGQVGEYYSYLVKSSTSIVAFRWLLTLELSTTWRNLTASGLNWQKLAIPTK